MPQQTNIVIMDPEIIPQVHLNIMARSAMNAALEYFKNPENMEEFEVQQAKQNAKERMK